MVSEGVFVATDLPLPLSGLFTRNWWVLLLRGILAILFGIIAFRAPVATLGALVLVFGIYALVDGIFALFAAVAGWGHREDRWLLVLEGLVGLGAGFATLRATALTAVVLLFFIASWALATGILKIVAAIRLRKEISNEFWLVFSGIASVIFAFLVMLNPAAGAMAMVWLIGWYALIMGTMLVILSFKLRGLRRLDYRTGVTAPPVKRAA
jgi:uncharacterized membrane protein HdeD (DUF308 family)